MKIAFSLKCQHFVQGQLIDVSCSIVALSRSCRNAQTPSILRSRRIIPSTEDDGWIEFERLAIAANRG